MFAALATMGVFLVIMLVVNLAFLLWVGLTKGDPAANQYGSPRCWAPERPPPCE